MGTLVFVCPTTGHEVSTGVEVDRSNYKRLLEDEDGGLLSALSQEPHTCGNLGLVGRRGPRKSGRQHFYEVCCVDRLPLDLNDPPQLARLIIGDSPSAGKKLRPSDRSVRIIPYFV